MSREKIAFASLLFKVFSSLAKYFNERVRLYEATSCSNYDRMKREEFIKYKGDREEIEGTVFETTQRYKKKYLEASKE